MEQLLYVNKATDTTADLFMGYGLIALLMELPPNNSHFNPTLQDQGGRYVIDLGKNDLENWIAQKGYLELNPFIQTSSRTALQAPEWVSNVIAYDEQKAINDTYWEALKKLSASDRRPKRAQELLRDQGIDSPHPHWAIWALINQQKAIKSYNKLVITWASHRGEAFHDLLRLIFTLFASPLNDAEQAFQDWLALRDHYQLDADATETAPQITNPGMGKGANYAKSTRVSEGNLEGFWLLEYLRFAGMYQAGISLTVQGAKDRKIYVPVPHTMQWGSSRAILSDYRHEMFASTAVKMDILATFRYMNVHLDHWKKAKQAEQDDLLPSQPNNHARAISVVFLKDMGSSHAVMRMNELPLPRWVIQVETLENADHYLAIIEEHTRVIESLHENHGDEYQVLRHYHRFLTTQDLRVFFEFASGYAHLLMSRLNNGDYAPYFSLPYLEEIFMASNPKLSPILENSGFLAIAEAIRRSTVIPQYQKAQNRENSYEIRYGLGDKLMRAATEKSKFIQELTEFMYQYNRETAQLAESRGMQFRKAITTENIAELVALLDDHDPKLIAGLLVSYGYARDPRKSEEQGE